MKKICLLLLFFGLVNCGYEAIYLKKNDSNILIKKIELQGDKSINRKIISFLNLKNDNNKTNGYQLKLNSEKEIEVVSKDRAGNATIHKTKISINASLSNENEIFKEKTFVKSFTYNAMSNKFDFSRYQKNIEENLIDKIIEEIFIFLNS